MVVDFSLTDDEEDDDGDEAAGAVGVAVVDEETDEEMSWDGESERPFKISKQLSISFLKSEVDKEVNGSWVVC